MSKLPGERTSPYQPDVELPEPFARQEFTEEDVTDISPAAHQFVLDKLEQAGAVYGWFRPFEEGKPLAMYGFHGGAEWTGAVLRPGDGAALRQLERDPVAAVGAPVRAAERRRDQAAADARAAVYEKNCMPCHGPNREGLCGKPFAAGAVAADEGGGRARAVEDRARQDAAVQRR